MSPYVDPARERARAQERKEAGYWRDREKTRKRDQKGRKGGAHSAALRSFVAIDSEGFNFGKPLKVKTKDGYELRQRHKTGMWMASDAAGHEVTLWDEKGCYGPNVWRWLTGLADEFPRNSIFVIFSGSYDFTQVLADLSYKDASQVAETMRSGSGHWTRCGDYGFRYVKGKRFSIARYGGYDPERKQTSWHHAITIYDTWGFFQASFLKALEGFPGLCSPEHLTVIKEGKAARSGEMATWTPQKIESYTRLELCYLAKMMHAFRDGLDAMGLKLSHWSGAGSIAGAILKAEGVKQHLWPMQTNIAFPPLLDDNGDYADPKLGPSDPPQLWGHYAYFGGRIEVLKSGKTEKPLYVYDIASAYPHIARLLPSMENGVWKYHDTAWIADLRRMSFCSMVYLSFKWKQRNDGYYPLPWRNEYKGIIYPVSGRGVYMVDEVLAAGEWMGRHGGEINILGVYEFVPAFDPPLTFGFVPGYFDQRAELTEAHKKGKPYDIREKVIKLGLNSIYGKMAQRVGGHGKAPPYSCIFYAAAITAGTRAMLIRATMAQMGSVVQFATDGIVSTKPLTIETSPIKALGTWECDKVKGGIFVMSGLYKYGKIMKTRGFGASSMKGKTLDQFFDVDVPEAWRDGLDEIAFEQQRYETFGRARASEERWKIAGYWIDAVRKINVGGTGSKRMGVAPGRHRELKNTEPFNLGDEDFMSGPIMPEWLDEDDGSEGDNNEQNQILDGFKME